MGKYGHIESLDISHKPACLLKTGLATVILLILIQNLKLLTSKMKLEIMRNYFPCGFFEISI